MLRIAALVLATLVAAACGGEPAAVTDRADGPGIVTGTITFDGTPPAPRPLRMDSDPLCMPEPGATSDLLLTGAGGGLQNVFVYIKDGLGARTYAVPDAPVLIDQVGCRYIPHVFGVQVGQTIMVSNSDPLMHNVHAVPRANKEFNFGQPGKTPPVPRVFHAPEIGVPFRCDVHGWMTAYANVVTHPFFAVTDADGRFEIKGLPAGTYTIELWHEQLGTETQSVTVDGTAPATVTAAFKPAS